MKNKYLLVLIVILGVIAIISSPSKSTTYFSIEKENKISIKNPETEEIKEVNLEDYVIGVVAAEMPASFQEEALKAQAIAARTYAVYKMEHTNKNYAVLTDISNQAYITTNEMKEKWQDDYNFYLEKIKKAVQDTKDIIMTYDGKTIISYYFAMSNGYTEDASLVFGEEEDYLESVDSLWDKNVRNYEVEITLSKSDFCSKLSLDCKNLTLGSINRSQTGRVNTIVINEKTFKGTEFRQLLSLRSTDFDLSITDVVVIKTRGYGHGVGMSQYGANEMAKLGYNYEDILKYYYQNIDFAKVSV